MKSPKIEKKTVNELKLRQQTTSSIKSRLFEFNSVQIDSTKKLLMYEEQVILI